MNYLLNSRQLRIINENKQQYIEFILPNTFYGMKFRLNKQKQNEINKCLNSLRISNKNVELKWDTVGLRNGNELDLFMLSKENLQKYKILKDLKPENFAVFDYGRHSMKIYLKNMHIIDKDWAVILEKDLREKGGHILHPLESIIINSGSFVRKNRRNKILLKNIPRSYTYDGAGRMKDEKEIEKNIEDMLIKTNAVFEKYLDRVELVIARPRNERIQIPYQMLN